MSIPIDFLQAIAKFNYQLNEPLAPYSTWRIGGPAEVLVIVNSAKELEQIVTLAYFHKVEWVILGQASNVLISDAGIKGLVIINKSRNAEVLIDETQNTDSSNQSNLKPTKFQNSKLNYDQIDQDSQELDIYIAPRHQESGEAGTLKFTDLDYSETAEIAKVRFDSGMALPLAIAWSFGSQLTGLQWFAGIPGTIGGALYNNIHGGTKHFSDYFDSCNVLEVIKPQVLIFAGPSGAGKSTLIKHLLESHPQATLSVSCTTRQPRSGEVGGQDYHFLTRDEFQTSILNNRMLEWEEVYSGDFYGTSRTATDEILKQGRTLIFDVDVKGAINLKKHFGHNALAILVAPPSLEVLETRLRSRGTETEAKIQERLAKATWELGFKEEFDHTLINNEWYDTLDNLAKILSNSTNLVHRTLNKSQMQFGYDQSLLRQNSKVVVLNVTLNLLRGDLERAKKTAQEWTKRKRIQPRVSCGSVFQSITPEQQEEAGIPNSAAGYIVDKILNLKGYTVGDAQISPDHGNFIPNLGNAKASDVLIIMKKVMLETYIKIGIKLVPEINFLGFDSEELNFWQTS